MKEAYIDDIAYQLKRNKENNLPGAVVFLGAGASVTSGIPSANIIAETILTRFGEAPAIKRLANEAKNYHELMACLTPNDRKTLLNEYIRSAKINVTHIYLAHLMVQGYVDYIVTVNFDNLTLRALALFNEFPATYDISILKEITTTSIDCPAVVFMHGQYHGLWQLNTGEEMVKINQTAPHIFRSIANQRPWIVVGYGANDPVFQHLVDLGRFDNNLFWVGYKEIEPVRRVRELLLDRSNSDALWVKGFDSDLFFLKLHSELNLEQPQIFSKPFSHIKKLHESIIDIQDENLKAVKERLEITSVQINASINKYEKGQVDKKSEKIDEQKDLLRLEIIDRILKEDFESFAELEEKVAKSNNSESYSPLLSQLCNSWGIHLWRKAQTSHGSEAEKLYEKSIEKYRRAIELKRDYAVVFYNLGISLAALGELKTGEEAEILYRESIEKYYKAIDLKPDDANAFSNLADTLADLAKRKTGEEREKLYMDSFAKYKKSTELNPNDGDVFYNWGISLLDLANIKRGDESEELYKESIEKSKKAIRLKPDDADAIYNWGAALTNLARNKKGKAAEKLHTEAISKYKKADELKPDDKDSLESWTTSLSSLVKLTSGEEQQKFITEYISVSYKAYKLGASPHKLASAYAWAKQKKEALKYLELALNQNSVSYENVVQAEEWESFKGDKDFDKLIKRAN
jgi:tetratricopeptide (TPR) repeat protein